MTQATAERTLPHSLEAEKAVLGAVLMHQECFEAASEVLTPAHFYREAHRRIFAAMRTLAAAGSAIDPLTLQEALARGKDLDAIGGPVYLASLLDGVPRSTNVARYARLVREKADLRAVIDAGQAMVSHAYEAEDEARVVLDRAEHAIFAIAQGTTTAGFKRLSEIMPAVLEQIDCWHRAKTGVSGVPSGFIDLDDLTRGFQRSNLIIVAARPSMGKSSFVLNIAQHVAGLGKTVGFFSLEMSDEELVTRALTGEARVDGHRLQRGFLRESEWGRLSHAMGVLGEQNLFIDESPFLTVFDMRSRARRLKTQHGLDLLIVDYTQLMVGDERKENRTLELASITRGLKALSKDLDIPVLALSQLSRDVERRPNKRPVLSDLRDSGALEQDADLVVFLYRDEVYDPHSKDRGVAEVIVGKARNGPPGTVRLAWHAQEMRFANLETTREPENARLPMGDRG